MSGRLYYAATHFHVSWKLSYATSALHQKYRSCVTQQPLFFMCNIETVLRNNYPSACPSKMMCSATYPLHVQHEGCILRHQLFACLGGCTQQHIHMEAALRNISSTHLCRSCVTQRQFFFMCNIEAMLRINYSSVCPP